MMHSTQRSSSIAFIQAMESSSFSEGSNTLGSIEFPQMKSQSIPISNNHFHRTVSELQLCVDEQIAEQRDYAFYLRVVNGIQQSQTSGKSQQLQLQNQMCLSHIMQTRMGAQQALAAKTMPMMPIPSEQEDWYVGLPVDGSPSIMPSVPIMDRHQVHAITADAIALANAAEEQSMIFDMDL